MPMVWTELPKKMTKEYRKHRSTVRELQSSVHRLLIFPSIRAVNELVEDEISHGIAPGRIVRKRDIPVSDHSTFSTRYR